MLGSLWSQIKSAAQGLDQRVVDDATFRAQEAGLAQSQAGIDQRRAHGDAIRSGRVSAADLAPEVFSLLGRTPRPGEDAELPHLRRSVADTVFGGAVPADLRSPAGEQRLRARLEALLQDAGGVGPVSPALHQLALALGEAQNIRRPSMAVNFHGAVQGLNNSLATSGLARAGLYGGIGLGGAAAIPLVTESGRALYDLIASLSEQQQQEAQSARGPQV